MAFIILSFSIIHEQFIHEQFIHEQFILEHAISLPKLPKEVAFVWLCLSSFGSSLTALSPQSNQGAENRKMDTVLFFNCSSLFCISGFQRQL